MPEGPEVRTVSDKLRPFLLDKVITNVYTDDRAKGVGFSNLKYPTKIIGVRSHGKKILIDTDIQYVIIISLGMVGRLQYTCGNHSHTRFDISTYELNGSLRILRPAFNLYFDDYRYMGSVDIIPNIGLSLYFKDIGPDLLQLSLNENTWIPLNIWLSIFTQKKLLKRSICDVLMDQSLISGIGNYLRAEILYYAAIHPERLIQSLSLSEWDKIRICSHKIIMLSYSYGGFTIESFISPDGSRGLYPAAVYGRSHDPLGNQVIKIKVKDGRTLHIVPTIQHS